VRYDPGGEIQYTRPLRAWRQHRQRQTHCVAARSKCSTDPCCPQYTQRIIDPTIDDTTRIAVRRSWLFRTSRAQSIERALANDS